MRGIDRSFRTASHRDASHKQTLPIHPFRLLFSTKTMSYLNTYKPPIIHSADYVSGGDEPYDLNFCLPVPEELSSERVKLVPFVVSLRYVLYPLLLDALVSESRRGRGSLLTP